MPPVKTNEQSNRFHPYQQPPTSHSDDDDGTTANTGDVVLIPADSPDLGTLKQTCKRCLISGETVVLCYADHLESLSMSTSANATASTSIILSSGDSTTVIETGGGSVSMSDASISMTINGDSRCTSMSFTSSSDSSASEPVGYIRFSSNGSETVIKHDCKGHILKKVVNGIEKRLSPPPTSGSITDAQCPTPATEIITDGQPQTTEPASFDSDTESSGQVHGQEPVENGLTPDDIHHDDDDDDDDVGGSDYSDDSEEDELTPGVHPVTDPDDPCDYYDDSGDENGNARNRVPSKPRPKCGPKSKRGKGRSKRKAKSKSKRKPSTASKKKPCPATDGTAPTGGDGAANAAAAGTETVGDVGMGESSSTDSPADKNGGCKRKAAGGGSSDEPPVKKRKVLKCDCKAKTPPPDDGTVAANDGAGPTAGKQSENGQVEQLADSVAVPCGLGVVPKKKKKKSGRSKSTCRGKSKTKPARKKPPKPKKSAGEACSAEGENDVAAESGDAGAAVVAAGDNCVNPPEAPAPA